MTPTTALAKLLPLRRAPSTPEVRLICLPFAGGGAVTYQEWPQALPTWIDVCAVELPGHGARLLEPPRQEMASLVNELLPALDPLFDLPAILFGHSLGARIAFALVRAGARASALVASGARAPHLAPKRSYSVLPRSELMKALAEMGGTPAAVLAEDELMDLLLPMIRADFGMAEKVTFAIGDTIACDIVAIAALDDAMAPLLEAAAWAGYTTGTFALHEIDEGGHFFLAKRRKEVLAHVAALAHRIRNDRNAR